MRIVTHISEVWEPVSTYESNHAGYRSLTKKTSFWPSFFGLSPEKTVTWKEKYARMYNFELSRRESNVIHIISVPEVWMGYCFGSFMVSSPSDRFLCS